jgi:hypothetical protein
MEVDSKGKKLRNDGKMGKRIEMNKASDLLKIPWFITLGSRAMGQKLAKRFKKSLY